MTSSTALAVAQLSRAARPRVNSSSAKMLGRAAAVAADQQVVEHGGVLEQLDVLERAGNAAPGDGVRRRRW